MLKSYDLHITREYKDSYFFQELLTLRNANSLIQDLNLVYWISLLEMELVIHVHLLKFMYIYVIIYILTVPGHALLWLSLFKWGKKKKKENACF